MQEMRKTGDEFRTIWQKPGNPSIVQIIDQRRLPHEYVIHDLVGWQDGADAISDMLVRGAPLIGATAAWSLYLAAIEHSGNADCRQQVLKAAKVEQQIKPAVAASPDDPWYSTRQASLTTSTLRDPSGFLENPLSDSTGGELPIKEVQMSLMPPLQQHENNSGQALTVEFFC